MTRRLAKSEKETTPSLPPLLPQADESYASKMARSIMGDTV